MVIPVTAEHTRNKPPLPLYRARTCTCIWFRAQRDAIDGMSFWQTFSCRRIDGLWLYYTSWIMLKISSPLFLLSRIVPASVQLPRLRRWDVSREKEESCASYPPPPQETKINLLGLPRGRRLLHSTNTSLECSMINFACPAASFKGKYTQVCFQKYRKPARYAKLSNTLRI